jgi:hypothetical protein
LVSSDAKSTFFRASHILVLTATGEWVIQQRKEFRNVKITEECIAKLNKLDFTWHGRSSSGGRKSLNGGESEVCYEFGEHGDGLVKVEE